jgi:hypothetical protein
MADCASGFVFPLNLSFSSEGLLAAGANLAAPATLTPLPRFIREKPNHDALQRGAHAAAETAWCAVTWHVQEHVLFGKQHHQQLTLARRSSSLISWGAVSNIPDELFAHGHSYRNRRQGYNAGSKDDS